MDSYIGKWANIKRYGVQRVLWILWIKFVKNASRGNGYKR